MSRQTAAISRSQVAQQAKPLGELISRMNKAKAEGKDPFDVVPPPPLPRPKKRLKGKETSLVRECLQCLARRGIWARRQNTGCLWVGGRPIYYGILGGGDITGILPDGRRLEIECKQPGNKQSSAQKNFEQVILRNNGAYLLVHSVQELEEKLNESV